MAASAPAGRDPAGLTTAETFLAEHPLTESVDLLLPDLNGILRGKRLRADQLAGALRGECYFTISLYALDSTGANVDRSGIVWEQGDPDRPVVLGPDTLRPVPWRPGGGLDQALEQERLVGGTDHVGAVAEVQFELAGRVLGERRLDGDVLRRRVLLHQREEAALIL